MKAIVPLAVLMLALSAAPRLEAQTASVRGTVKDQSGHPVRGAVVAIENEARRTKFGTTTDKKGQFVILGLGSGVWTLSVTSPGFEPVLARADVSMLQRIPNLDIRLLHSPVPSSLGMTGREIQQRIDGAEALASKGEIDGAIAAYTDLVTKVPALTAVYLQLGELYERKGDTAAALAAYRKLAELEPANAKARTAIERLTTR